MSHALPLSEDQRDCLQEITNVAVGAAAESLADLTHHFVCLPIPVIRCVDTETLIAAFDEIEINTPTSTISEQCMVGDIPCQALVLVDEVSVNSLGNAVANDVKTNDDSRALLQDLYLTLSDTCFDRLGEIFEAPVARQQSKVAGLNVPPESFDLKNVIDSQHMVAVEIHYHTEGHPFNCHLLLLFPDSAVERLTDNLDRLLR